ncbi:MAG: hypothetical protein JW963_12945 [Anaerolineales bacterium]|nr:hypothetical protein [Anaerolineales bacterium]
MLRSGRVALTLITLSILVLSCVLTTVDLQDSGAISTSAAQTVIAGFTQAAVSATLSPILQEATFTWTPELPTSTPTQTLTATAAFTSTPFVPQISVSVPTNCRVGPGKVYRRVGALLVGETAEVYGRDPTGRYWYIRNPDSGSEYCWIWGEYATITGNTAFLPVYTPPPTPTPTFTPKPTFTPTPSPDFEAAYSSLDTCVGWWVEIKLQNTGSIPFKSMGITIKDTGTDIVIANYVDGFTDINGCLSSTTRDTLGPGKTYVVSAPAFNYDPSGHKLRATIILCSDLDQNGICVTKTINFTP